MISFVDLKTEGWDFMKTIQKYEKPELVEYPYFGELVSLGEGSVPPSQDMPTESCGSAGFDTN